MKDNLIALRNRIAATVRAWFDTLSTDERNAVLDVARKKMNGKRHADP